MGTDSLGLFEGDKTWSLSIQIGLGAGGFGFFDGFSCFGLILTKFCAKFPDGPLPAGTMDALVISSPLRVLLAFLQSSIASTRGVTLSDLEVTAMGEMLVEIPSRDASAIPALTWDEVSTGWSSSFGGWEGGIRMTTWHGLLGVELLDPWLDVSSISWDKKSLTSLVMLPSPSDFSRVDLWGLAIMMVETSPRGGTFSSGSFTMGGGMSISR